MIETMKFTAFTFLAIPVTVLALFMLYMPMHLLARALGFRR